MCDYFLVVKIVRRSQIETALKLTVYICEGMILFEVNQWSRTLKAAYLLWRTPLDLTTELRTVMLENTVTLERRLVYYCKSYFNILLLWKIIMYNFYCLFISIIVNNNGLHSKCIKNVGPSLHFFNNGVSNFIFAHLPLCVTGKNVMNAECCIRMTLRQRRSRRKTTFSLMSVVSFKRADLDGVVFQRVYGRTFLIAPRTRR